ncbi:hypothetical protein ACFL5V_01590 [Fibrobacterota bacterium]
MKFSKKGLIFCPKGEHKFMNSHAQVPTILEGEKHFRVYFSTRPNPKLSLTTFLDIDKNNPKKVIYLHDKSIIPCGGPGTFDEFGVMPSTVVRKEGVVYMFYTGWSRGETVPYLNAVGLAVSEDNGKTFEKHSKGPIIERREHEPFSAMSPYVLYEHGTWHMWYSSGTGWYKSKVKYEPIYLIKYAKSTDGIHWNQTNIISINPKNELEAMTRPSVVKIADKYHMWFCYRDSLDYRGGRGSYRIGYADSDDMINWRRKDSKAGITVSKKGWDSVMVQYPQIIKLKNKLLMFYNGNGFGASGIGYAVGEMNKIKL